MFSNVDKNEIESSASRKQKNNSLYKREQDIFEIREYIVELKGYFDTFTHEIDQIKELESGQNTMCPYELS